jgi:glutaredoxin
MKKNCYLLERKNLVLHLFLDITKNFECRQQKQQYEEKNWIKKKKGILNVDFIFLKGKQIWLTSFDSNFKETISKSN